MKAEGVLQKMQTELAEKVQYHLDMDGEIVHMNELLDHEISLRLRGSRCLCCGKERSIFRQGFCYPCFFSSPSTGAWVMKPELCTAHLDIEDRDLEYEKEIQLTPHIVYLANSGDVKVGITRKTQVPTRWIDQGAHLALPILEVPNRYLSGMAEIALKTHVSDRTNWRNMLKNEIKKVDLEAVRQELESSLPAEVAEYFMPDAEPLKIEFPVLLYPRKVKSFNFKKEKELSGILKGIKGQYLIFEDGTVINIRSNSGYVVELEVG